MEIKVYVMLKKHHEKRIIHETKTHEIYLKRKEKLSSLDTNILINTLTSQPKKKNYYDIETSCFRKDADICEIAAE